jgi:hypothetical protein
MSNRSRTDTIVVNSSKKIAAISFPRLRGKGGVRGEYLSEAKGLNCADKTRLFDSSY